MTLRELEARRLVLLGNCLQHNRPDDWMDLEGLDEEIRRRHAQRQADARLVDQHQRFYGAQPEDALLLDDDVPFTFGDPLPPMDEAR